MQRGKGLVVVMTCAATAACVVAECSSVSGMGNWLMALRGGDEVHGVRSRLGAALAASVLAAIATRAACIYCVAVCAAASAMWPQPPTDITAKDETKMAPRLARTVTIGGEGLTEICECKEANLGDERPVLAVRGSGNKRAHFRIQHLPGGFCRVHVADSDRVWCVSDEWRGDPVPDRVLVTRPVQSLPLDCLASRFRLIPVPEFDDPAPAPPTHFRFVSAGGLALFVSWDHHPANASQPGTTFAPRLIEARPNTHMLECRSIFRLFPA
jgi:hypothetical protein